MIQAVQNDAPRPCLGRGGPSLVAIAALLLLFPSVLGADDARPKPGILDKPAPAWGVSKWIQTPADKQALDVGDFKGKVVYLYCFQSWCPGCHKYGFPTLQKVSAHFSGDKDVAFVAVQTTFEGAQVNTPKRAWATARKYELTMPIGHADSDPKGRPLLMNRYRTGGTPWVIIIDRDGVVRYNDFHITPKAATRLIDTLKATEPSKK